jgi:FkbM family methyltransferase
MLDSKHTQTRTFMGAYVRLLTTSVINDYRDNYDWRRFGPEKLTPRSLREKLGSPLIKILKFFGFVRLSRVVFLTQKGLRFVESCGHDLAWLHQHLQEDESSDLLVQIMAYRAVGRRYIKLPLNTPEYWRLVEKMEMEAEGNEVIDSGFLGFRLSRMDLRGIGYPIELFFVPFAIVIQFIDQPYRCVTSERTIEAKEGDVVIDAGGCYGDTALYFAHKVGPRGKVASFEFLPDNLKIYQRNLDMNPDLAKRILLLPHPLWSEGDQNLYISGCGPGTSVGTERQNADAQVVRTLSIDQVLKRGDVDRADFIKMDIEGAELAALHGAEETLRRFRPKLAISVYHKLQDFWQIPQYLDSLNLGYKFYLRHFTIHQEETVLYAAVL